MSVRSRYFPYKLCMYLLYSSLKGHCTKSLQNHGFTVLYFLSCPFFLTTETKKSRCRNEEEFNTNFTWTDFQLETTTYLSPEVLVLKRSVAIYCDHTHPCTLQHRCTCRCNHSDDRFPHWDMADCCTRYQVFHESQCHGWVCSHMAPCHSPDSLADTHTGRMLMTFLKIKMTLCILSGYVISFQFWTLCAYHFRMKHDK